MSEELSAADRASLAGELGPVNMAVGGLLLFEDGDGMRHEQVLERVGARLHLVPRYRQRLQSGAGGRRHAGRIEPRAPTPSVT